MEPEAIFLKITDSVICYHPDIIPFEKGHKL